MTEIVVTGSRPAVETRIDRRVYAVSGNLQGDIGSAADVLRNIPSLSVDLEGNPSLRGDPTNNQLTSLPPPEFSSYVCEALKRCTREKKS